MRKTYHLIFRLPLGPLASMGSDLRSTLVIREMKFYCIDAQRFTALSDDSIRDLVYSARHAHFQVRYFLCLCTEHGIELHLT